MNTIVHLGFYYKGASITIDNPKQIKELISTFDFTIPAYRTAIKEKGQAEIDFYFEQLDEILKEYLNDGQLPPQDISILFMMNVYVLTKLGIIKDDNMNGLTYIYTK